MAYKLPERREREPPPSYLDDFLDKLEGFPTQMKNTFQEMRNLDDKIQASVHEADGLTTEAIHRATTKGVALEQVKRTMNETVHLHASTTEWQQRKRKLAADMLQLVQGQVEEMDKKLMDFEKQLKKEGRWPRDGEEPVKKPRSAKAPVHLSAERALKNIERLSKGRRSTNPTTPRAAALAARAEEKGRKKEEEDTSMDDKLYCTCRKVSHGSMVACEGKNCKIEWFHFDCVGLTSEPKGAWYCDQCLANMNTKRKSSGGRKK